MVGHVSVRARSSASQSSVMQCFGPALPRPPNAASPINSVICRKPQAITSALSDVVMNTPE